MRYFQDNWRTLITPLLGGTVFAYVLMAFSAIIEGNVRLFLEVTLAFAPVLVFIPGYLQVKYHAITHPVAFLAGERGARLLKVGDVQGALPYLDRAVSLHPKLALYRHNRGLAHFASADWDSARADFDAAIRLKPQGYASYLMRANLNLIGNRREAALEDVNTALRLKPSQVLALALRGVIHHRMGNLEAAIEDYRQCLRVNPAFIDVYLNLGTAYAEHGDRDAAIQVYTAAITLSPRFGQAYNNRAYELALRGNLKAAMFDVQMGIRYTPQYASLYSTRGMINFLMERYTHAIQDFQHSRHLQTTYNFAIAGLAATYHALGNTVNVEEAVRLWTQLVETNTRYTDAEWVRKELSLPDAMAEETSQIIQQLDSSSDTPQ